MFALTDVLHLLTHEFTGLSARRLTFPFIPTGPLDRSLLRHVNLQSTDEDRNLTGISSDVCRSPAAPGCQKLPTVALCSYDIPRPQRP
jgi:hypothetical protein